MQTAFISHFVQRGTLIRLSALLLLLLTQACSPTPSAFNNRNASGYYVDQNIQCVPYAREASGLQLSGDAYTWWEQAQTRYIRGNKPRVGSALVLKRTQRMRSGHVAVVNGIIDKRAITVTHSNWGSDSLTRRIIYQSMRVEDVSKRNDWTSVRFWNNQKNVMGNPYAAYGFIYP